MQISEQEIKRIVHNERNFQWGKKHYRDNTIFDDFSIEEVASGLKISSKISYGYYKNNVSVIVDKKGRIVAHNCNCRFHDVTDGCGHIAALLLRFNMIASGESTFYKASVNDNIAPGPIKEFVQDLIDNRQQRIEAARKAEIERYAAHNSKLSKRLLNHLFEEESKSTFAKVDNHTYYLQPVVDFKVYDQDDYDLEVSFKVGKDKFYVIKNISQFLKLLDAKEYHYYGKNLEMIHDQDKFDDTSQKLIEYMRLEEHDATNRYRYYTIGLQRTINVNYENLDRFYDLFSQDDFDIDISFLEEDFSLEINVEIMNDYYVLTTYLDETLFRGENSLYEMANRQLIRKNIPNYNLFENIFDTLYQDGMYLEKQDYLAFRSYLESTFGENVSFKGEIVEDSPFEERIKLYASLDDDYLNLNTSVEFADGHSQSLFENNDEYMTSYDAKKLKIILENFSGTLDQDKTYQLALSNDRTISFMEDVLPSLNDYCEVFVSDEIKNFSNKKSLSASVGVRVANDLLHIDIDNLNCKLEELQGILSAYRKKRKFHRLKNGDILSLEGKAIEEFDQMVRDLSINVKDLNKSEFDLPVYHAFEMDDKLKNFEMISGKSEESFENFLSKFSNVDSNELSIKDKYNQILKDYQKHGVRWMKLLSTYGLGGILADDMGLGKTLQTISLLESTQQKGKQNLVVTPASLLLNWQDEFTKFESDLKFICIYGSRAEREEQLKNAKDYDVIITTYDYLKRDVELYEKMHFDHIIIDEAQYIKNPKTQAARSVKKLKGRVRFALTGTPIENTLAELWSIFDYLMPTYLYNYNYFKEYYEAPIVLNNDKDQQVALKKKIEPFILRRRKQDVLKDLPDKVEKNVRFNFDEEEEKLYVAKLAQVNQDLAEFANNEENNSLAILKLLLQLRQICCEPRLLFDNIKNISSKMRGCLEIVESLKENQQKVLIFSSFTSTLDLLAQELKKRNISFLTLTGEVNKTKRKELTEKFQNDEVDVFLISLKAGGVGLNLTNAQAVIHFDPWWNLSAQNQATDRAHRIGQENKVSVYNLIMKNSIEEKILDIQQQKKEIADMFVEQSTGSITKMSASDIMELLKRE